MADHKLETSRKNIASFFWRIRRREREEVVRRLCKDSILVATATGAACRSLLVLYVCVHKNAWGGQGALGRGDRLTVFCRFTISNRCCRDLAPASERLCTAQVRSVADNTTTMRRSPFCLVMAVCCGLVWGDGKWRDVGEGGCVGVAGRALDSYACESGKAISSAADCQALCETFGGCGGVTYGGTYAFLALSRPPYPS